MTWQPAGLRRSRLGVHRRSSPRPRPLARRLVRRLQHAGIRHVVASPYLRTVHTAHYVVEAIGVPLHVDAGLSEWLNAEWFNADPTRLTMKDLQKRFRCLELSPGIGEQPVYPETEREAVERAGRTAQILADHYEGDLLIVEHGVSVAGCVYGLFGERFDLSCPLCSLFELERRSEGWIMVRCADVDHLDASLAAERYH